MTVLDRDLVVVHGPEAFSFLQSLVSQDLDPVGDGDVVDSLLLTPQGKLDVAFRLVRVGDEAWLDCDAGFGAQLAASLNRFRIRVKAEVDDRSDGWGMVAVRDGDGLAAPPGCVAFPNRDVIGPVAALELIAGRGLGDDGYERWRIETGIPKLGVDVNEKTIPQEAFLEQSAVSFTKGCFLGQELVCRIDTRGHVNKYLRRLEVAGADCPEIGAEIRTGDTIVGAVTSVTPVDGRPVVALGYLRREVEVPAEVSIDAPAGSLAAVAGEMSVSS
ncbi:MAG: CAF17-like 4Fe-4S cluster assembly/insertion protein YgfZ [Acidimicrobiia bacterium]